MYVHSMLWNLKKSAKGCKPSAIHDCTYFIFIEHNAEKKAS